jgi:effector-binding domain-containing protein
MVRERDAGSVPAVEVVEAAPFVIAASGEQTSRSDLSNAIRRCLDAVYEQVRSGTVVQTGHNVVVYLDGALAIVAGVVVAGAFPAASAVRPFVVPGGPVVQAMHVGPYQRMGEAHGAIDAHCAANGLDRTGLSWEVYGDWHEDESRLETFCVHQLRV